MVQPNAKRYSLWQLLKASMELISRSPAAFAVLTVTLMANEHAMQQLRWHSPEQAWIVDGLYLILWPSYFVLTALIARYAHFGDLGLKFPSGNIGRAIHHLLSPALPIAIVLLPAYYYGIPALNPLVGVAFALVASSWMWSFGPLSMLFHGLSPEKARAHTLRLRRTHDGIGLSTILWMVAIVCAGMFILERSQWAAVLGPVGFILVVTNVYSAYTLTAEYRETASPAAG